MPRKKKVPKADKYQPAPFPEDAAIDEVLSRIRRSNKHIDKFVELVDELPTYEEILMPKSQEDQPE